MARQDGPLQALLPLAVLVEDLEHLLLRDLLLELLPVAQLLLALGLRGPGPLRLLGRSRPPRRRPPGPGAGRAPRGGRRGPGRGPRPGPRAPGRRRPRRRRPPAARAAGPRGRRAAAAWTFCEEGFGVRPLAGASGDGCSYICSTGTERGGPDLGVLSGPHRPPRSGQRSGQEEEEEEVRFLMPLKQTASCSALRRAQAAFSTPAASSVRFLLSSRPENASRNPLAGPDSGRPRMKPNGINRSRRSKARPARVPKPRSQSRD